jgi:tripeptide aminopeptidase
MPTVLDRFLRYVRYDTRSDEQSTTYPSTDTQLVLLRDLAVELRDLGLSDAAVDEFGYVMATIRASPAGTISTRAWSGSPRRTWRRRSK